jgi:outer membrane protein TolC
MSATTALASSQADVSRLVGQQRIDKMKLNETIGRPLTTQFTVSLPACALPTIQDAEADHNPNVETALLLADQAQQKKRVITAGYWPDISLAVSYYQLTTAIAGLPDKVVVVGLQASWDPFDWGQRRLEARAADAAFRAAKAAYSDAQAQHEIAIATVRQSIKDGEMYFRAARLASDAAEEGLRVATNEYTVGAVPLSRLLDAHKRDVSAKADLVTARLAMLRAQNALSLQLGSTTP